MERQLLPHQRQQYHSSGMQIARQETSRRNTKMPNSTKSISRLTCSIVPLYDLRRPAEVDEERENIQRGKLIDNVLSHFSENFLAAR